MFTIEYFSMCPGTIYSVLLAALHVKMSVMSASWIVLYTGVHLSVEILHIHQLLP
jgi:hypothetical protein